jgi:DNA polymerase-3 subunit gamma/tau
VAAEEQQQQQRSLYRRHRPRTFAQVVGQEAVVRTLRNAVEQNKVHHAYLFVGSRGTGKTSMAKILAACLNCEHGPTIEPCGVCESCVSIARASSLDVIEMDAASNNSVDDIRELRDSVAYAPVSGRRKVYILDEAHMLSTAAWNAFLKTLEEPPPNTVFVLATTEAAKVPATVVDRCHRFDFQRPTHEQLASVIRRVAAEEAIEIPPAAVAAIARAATGSFRDALGTLEQLVTYSGSQIELEDVLAVLGLADARVLEQIVDAVAQADAAAALRLLEDLLEQGRDPSAVIRDLEARARELLLVASLGAIPAELSLTPEADSALVAQAERCPPACAVRLLELLGEAMEGVRAGSDPRTRLELALVKAANPALDVSTSALLARIARLEGGGPPRPGAGPPAARPSASPTEAAGEDGAGAVVNTAPQAVEQAAQAVEQAAQAVEQAVHAVEQAPGAELEQVQALWPSVVELVKADNAMLGALIEVAQPVHAEEGILTLAFASAAQFYRKKAEDPGHRAIVIEALRSLTGARWKLAFELREVAAQHASEHAGEQSEEELLRRFIDEFDAEEIPGDTRGEDAEAQSRVASANEGAG